VSRELHHAPIAVVDEDRSALSQRIAPPCVAKAVPIGIEGPPLSADPTMPSYPAPSPDTSETPLPDGPEEHAATSFDATQRCRRSTDVNDPS
jgi:hypothetical protein